MLQNIIISILLIIIVIIFYKHCNALKHTTDTLNLCLTDIDKLRSALIRISGRYRSENIFTLCYKSA